MAAALAARQPEEPKLLGWRLWRGLGKSKFGDQRGLRQGGEECAEGLGDVEGVLVVCQGAACPARSHPDLPIARGR